MAFKVKDKLSGKEREVGVFCGDKCVHIETNVVDFSLNVQIMQFECIKSCEYLTVSDGERAFWAELPKSEVLLLIEGLQHLYNQMK